MRRVQHTATIFAHRMNGIRLFPGCTMYSSFQFADVSDFFLSLDKLFMMKQSHTLILLGETTVFVMDGLVQHDG